MSKIAEQKVFEAYSICNDMTDFQRQYERYAYLKGYDQVMQDFLEKACEWLCDNTMRELVLDYESTELIKDFCENFKNYMQNE